MKSCEFGCSLVGEASMRIEVKLQTPVHEGLRHSPQEFVVNVPQRFFFFVYLKLLFKAHYDDLDNC